MVFGFGEGKIDLVLDKTVVKHGDTINGKLKLSLKKPKEARQLRVRILAEKISGGGTRVGPRMGGGVRVSQSSGQKQVLYSNDVVLDGEKEYSPGDREYKFQVQVPGKDVLPSAKMPEGALGDVLGGIATLAGANVRISWFLIASLDAPGKDISKRVQLSVS